MPLLRGGVRLSHCGSLPVVASVLQCVEIFASRPARLEIRYEHDRDSCSGKGSCLISSCRKVTFMCCLRPSSSMVGQCIHFVCLAEGQRYGQWSTEQRRLVGDSAKALVAGLTALGYARLNIQTLALYVYATCIFRVSTPSTP